MDSRIRYTRRGVLFDTGRFEHFNLSRAEGFGISHEEIPNGNLWVWCVWASYGGKRVPIIYNTDLDFLESIYRKIEKALNHEAWELSQSPPRNFTPVPEAY